MEHASEKILVTGGAGFIGSHICTYLIIKGYHVRVLDNFSSGLTTNIEHLINHPNFELMEGDIRDINTCKKACKDITYICHQAAFISVALSVKDPVLNNDINVNGFLNILTAAKEHNIKRIVYATSAAVYGDCSELPSRESNIGNPLSPYGLSKHINEEYAYLFGKLYNMETIGLRYTNVYGKRQKLNGDYSAVIPKFISMLKKNEQPIIYGDGNFSRDFVHVDNVAYANYLALTTTNSKAYNQIFNIGLGVSYTINDLYHIIKTQLNTNIEPKYENKREGDIPHTRADITKALNILGYKIITDFNEGLNSLL